jgi:hypothetical protein
MLLSLALGLLAHLVRDAFQRASSHHLLSHLSYCAIWELYSTARHVWCERRTPNVPLHPVRCDPAPGRRPGTGCRNEHEGLRRGAESAQGRGQRARRAPGSRRNRNRGVRDGMERRKQAVSGCRGRWRTTRMGQRYMVSRDAVVYS